MLLDEPGNKVHVYFTVGATAQGGAIHHKTSALDTISFAPGTGTVVMRDGSGIPINNASSTSRTSRARRESS
jgi:hypothetical protein